MKKTKPYAFGLATAMFVCGICYIWVHRYSTPMNITHFAALEYCGIYIYTIYDKIKND